MINNALLQAAAAAQALLNAQVSAPNTELSIVACLWGVPP
jgi:hypothetical protein